MTAINILVSGQETVPLTVACNSTICCSWNQFHHTQS